MKRTPTIFVAATCVVATIALSGFLFLYQAGPAIAIGLIGCASFIWLFKRHLRSQKALQRLETQVFRLRKEPHPDSPTTILEKHTMLLDESRQTFEEQNGRRIDHLKDLAIFGASQKKGLGGVGEDISNPQV